MGTNYYWKELPNELKQYKKYVLKNSTMDKKDTILYHIGKSSAGGLYCIHCGITFHKFGTCQIHGELNPFPNFNEMFSKDEAIAEKAIKEYEKEKNLYWYNKCPCCGGDGTFITTFNWTMMLHKKIMYNTKEKDLPIYMFSALIKNEYDEEFSMEEFLQQIKTPIEYQTACDFM